MRSGETDGSGPLTRCFAASLLALLLLAACADTHTLMPAPDLDRGSGALALFADLPPSQRRPPLDLLYLTNRAPTERPEDDPPYGTDRSRSLAFGTAEVLFGEGIDWETLAEESGRFERRTPIELRLGRVAELGRFPPLPYEVRRSAAGLSRADAVVDAHESAAAALQADIAKRLAAAPRREIVLFVHGFNTRFRDAALTMAELCHFLGREFVCGVFSWPAGGSRGLLFGYNFDRESSEYSLHHLKQAIRLVAQTPGLERLHLVAHSRGTDLLSAVTEALMIESHVMREPWFARHRIANIVLIAPDLDAEIAKTRLFSILSDPDLPLGRQSAPRIVLPLGETRVTIYASPDDRALGLARMLFGSLRRLGGIDPATIGRRRSRARGRWPGSSISSRFRAAPAGSATTTSRPTPRSAPTSSACCATGTSPAAPDGRSSRSGRPSGGSSGSPPRVSLPPAQHDRIEWAREFQESGPGGRMQRLLRVAHGIRAYHTALHHRRLGRAQAALPVLVVDERQDAGVLRQPPRSRRPSAKWVHHDRPDQIGDQARSAWFRWPRHRGRP